jgi:hypothetical protein
MITVTFRAKAGLVRYLAKEPRHGVTPTFTVAPARGSF